MGWMDGCRIGRHFRGLRIFAAIKCQPRPNQLDKKTTIDNYETERTSSSMKQQQQQQQLIKKNRQTSKAECASYDVVPISQ